MMRVTRTRWFLIVGTVLAALLGQQTSAFSSDGREKIIDFCVKPKVISTSPVEMKSSIQRALRGLAPNSALNILSNSFVRLWRMSQGAGYKDVDSNRLRRSIRKALRLIKRTPNKPTTFDHPKLLLLYGIARLQDRSLDKIERHCLDHDTHKVFSFVPGSFLLDYPTNKPCDGLLYTELRRKIGFSELYYPILTPFRRIALNLSGQRIDVFAWKNAAPSLLDKVGQVPAFRYKLLQLRKSIAASKDPAQQAKDLETHKLLIDREVSQMKKKMQDINTILGGYLLIHPHKGKPAYFGHLQLANLKGFLQPILNSSVGRWVLLSAVQANMEYIARP